MTAEEEVVSLRQEKRLLQEQLAQRDEVIAHMQQEIVLLREQVHTLQEPTGCATRCICQMKWL